MTFISFQQLTGKQPMYDFKSMTRTDLIAELQAFEEKLNKRVAEKVRERTAKAIEDLNNSYAKHEVEEEKLRKLTCILHTDLSLKVLQDAVNRVKNHSGFFGFNSGCPYADARVAIINLQEKLKNLPK